MPMVPFRSPIASKAAAWHQILSSGPRPKRELITPNAKFCSDCGTLLSDLPANFKGKTPLCKPCLSERRWMQQYRVSSKSELYEILDSQPVYDDSEESFVKSLDTDALANYRLLMHEGPQPEDDDPS